MSLKEKMREKQKERERYLNNQKASKEIEGKRASERVRKKTS